MGHIQNRFEKLIKQAITYYSQEFKVSRESIQIQLSLKTVDNPEAGYKIFVCNDGVYVPKREVKVIEIIHPGKKYKIDFTGMSQLVHPLVGKIIGELAVQNSIEPAKTSVFCLLYIKGEQEKIVLYLFNENVFVKRLDPATVFNDEKVLI